MTKLTRISPVKYLSCETSPSENMSDSERKLKFLQEDNIPNLCFH